MSLAGSPYPIQVVSPRLGNDAYTYTLDWANPKTGGQPIEKYTIRFRQVNDFRCFDTSTADWWNSEIHVVEIHVPLDTKQVFLGTQYNLSLKFN